MGALLGTPPGPTSNLPGWRYVKRLEKAVGHRTKQIKKIVHMVHDNVVVNDNEIGQFTGVLLCVCMCGGAVEVAPELVEPFVIEIRKFSNSRGFH